MQKTNKEIKACVFDAYGTLFDVNSAAMQCQDELGQLAGPLSQLWRTRQVEYSWLRSLMQEYTDFWQITGDALDFAMSSLKIENPGLRERLMDIYKRLEAYEEVPQVLKQLKAANIKTAILSNGSPDMLGSAVQNAGISDLIDEIYSVDKIKIFKPDPKVYQLAVDGLDTPKENICFMSSNGWDASGAAVFGFQVNWINRTGLPQERLPGYYTNTFRTLSELPVYIGNN